jgi:glycine cleavage system H lipoate-binding protein
MFPHDILTLYSTKAIEYLIAIAFLVAFVPFWKYVSAELPAAQRALQPARHKMYDLVEWFRMAGDVAFHPGHAWARVEAPGSLTVGLDDFAQKLVGPFKSVELPPVGTRLAEGQAAWRLHADGSSVQMLSPVDGVVTAVNPRVVESPSLVNRDPFGRGWLLRVESPRFDPVRRGLMNGRTARHWLEEATEQLRMKLSPELGVVMQDGGTPVDGIAHAIDPERWDRIAAEFFLTDERDLNA